MTVVVPLIALLCAFTCALYLLRRSRRLELELQELRGSFRIDQVTLLRSRQAFGEDLQLEVARVARTGRPACLVVLSVDDPESVREAGARRSTLAETLNSTVRAIDLRYRIGANEFALVLPETRARGALVAAQRIDEALQVAGVGTIAAGVAELGPGIDHHLLFRHAYCALLAAGHDGRSHIVAYSLELERAASWAAALEGIRQIEPAPSQDRGAEAQ
ncbi:MAG: GGDEF domain-containing protein [Solirubrobacteraceae bacterium]